MGEDLAMGQPSARPAEGLDLAAVRAARRRPADQLAAVQAECGHRRYTKGCDVCALVGIYRDHLSRPGITPAERSAVQRLYLAGDKAALFKLWQALAAAKSAR
jgi:hypothetical protein